MIQAHNPKSVWSQACGHLKIKLSPAVYNTWIISNPLTKIESNNDVFLCTITSPTAFHSINIKKNLSSQIKESIELAIGKKINLAFEVGSPSKQNREKTTNNKASREVKKTTTETGENSSLFSQQVLSISQEQQQKFQAQKAGLRKDYSFESFAVSSTNEMAHAAAIAVSRQPGSAYNPLFLYGGVGVGKTHLMHAIGNNIINNSPQSKIIYTTSETFTNEIVSAIQTKKALHFKHKYRSTDVLLIDDIQFIAGKNTVQEEFFHTFNSLIGRSAQIILTSDRPPHEISLLEDRLRSRFEAGLMIDIQQPTFELRTAILLTKAKAHNIFIPMELAQFIASKVESARKIEGVVKSIKSEVELKKAVMNQELVKKLISGEINHGEHERLRVRPQEVIKTVSDHFHIKQITIKGKSRVKSIVRARHVAMFLMKSKLKMSYTEIGRCFSGRDHTTSMHAVGKIKKNINNDDQLRQDISAISVSLNSLSR
ncbi:MAG: chromosomal replication initiator protein DnaA [Patescibacteria group bacterium]